MLNEYDILAMKTVVAGMFFKHIYINTSGCWRFFYHKSMNLDIIIKHSRQSDVGSTAHHNEYRQHCLFWWQNEIIPKNQTMNIKHLRQVKLWHNSYKGDGHILHITINSISFFTIFFCPRSPLYAKTSGSKEVISTPPPPNRIIIGIKRCF